MTRRAGIVFALLTAGFFTAALCPSPAFAQGKLKRLVFEDCDAAKQQASQLPADQQAAFCSYLTRVLTMQVGVSGELLAPVSPPAGGAGAPLDSIPGGSLWHIFEPSREQEAKRCAIDLLLVTSPACAPLVPEMLPLFDRKLLSDDLLWALERAVWQLVLRMKELPEPPDGKWFGAVISQLGNDSSAYLAANILYELRERSVTHLLSALTSAEPKRRDIAQTYLLRLDGEGDLLGAPLLALLESGDEDLRMRAAKLLARLPRTYPQAVPRLIERLGDPSAVVESGIYAALDTMLETGPLLEVPKTGAQTDMLFRMFDGATPEHRAVLEEAVRKLAEPSQATVDRLSTLSRSSDPDIRERSLRMLAPFCLSHPGLLSNLYDALYDAIPGIRLAAVRVLSSDPSKPEEKSSALLKALKSNASEKDPSGRNEFVVAVAKAVRSLPETTSTVRMAPYFIDALSYRPFAPGVRGGDSIVRAPETETEPVRTLIYLGKESLPPVTRALRDADPLVRRRALYVLGRIEPVERQTAKLLVYMLKDADAAVRMEAEATVQKLGAEIVPEVRKGLEWKEIETQLSAAKVLLALGVRDADVERVFREGFSRATCAEKLDLVKPLVALSEEYRTKAQPFLADCIKEEPTSYVAVFDALLALTPLQESVIQKLTAVMKERKLPRGVQLQLLERANRLGLPSGETVAVLRDMLNEKDNSVRNLVIGLLPEFGEAAKAAVPELKSLAEDQDEESILRSKAVFVLVRLAPDALDWQRFFVKALDSDGARWAASTVEKLPLEQTLPVLRRALSELSSERKAETLSLIGKFGPAAVELRDELVRLTKDGDAAIRHQATLALLRVDPQNAELLNAFRGELIGRFGALLQDENLGTPALPLLEQIAAAPQSLAEKHAAEALMKSVRSAKPA